MTVDARLIDTDEDRVKGRIVRLRTPNKSYEALRLANSARQVGRVERNELTRDGSELNEIYIELTLDKLRKLDRNERRQTAFIAQKLRFLERQRINMVVIRLRLSEGQSLRENDTLYLWDLLSLPSNDILVVPLVEDADPERQYDTYEEFAQSFIRVYDSYGSGNLACTIPHFAHHSRIPDLITHFEEVQTPVFVYDFGGRRPLPKYPNLGALHRGASERFGDDYFLAGLDIKPYKSSRDVVGADDLGVFAYGFNSTGRRHSVQRIPPAVAEFIRIHRPDNPFESLRLLRSEDFGYHPGEQIRSEFDGWANDLPTSLRPTNEELMSDYSARGYAKAFNRYQANNSSDNIEESIRTEDLAQYLFDRAYADETLMLAQKVRQSLR